MSSMTRDESLVCDHPFLFTARVSFIVCVDGKEQEIPADINKEVSHQVKGMKCIV